MLVFWISAEAQTPQKPLQRLSGTITLDGLSNETAWKNIQPFPLIMFGPTYEGTPTERTEILMAYDENFIYAAARCYDSISSSIQANSLSRDGFNPSDDGFFLVLDTFNDNENALSFITNPSGIREDWAIFNDAESQTAPPFNSSWNTFWDVATARTDEGWFAEIRIPFSSLRFEDQQGHVTMGVIVSRYIARKNELHIFPNIPPKWSWALVKPSVAQDVTMEGVYRHNPVYITPYLLGGLGRDFDLNDEETAYVRSDSRKRELGLDLKYGITSNLTVDLTYNTDFAQVEADDQQVNLTRFSLFFPEKRLFFQERSSIFDNNLGGDNRLFYSRAVGLSEEGPVKIYGGARLVGRVESWDIGFLEMQTAKSIDLPSENFGVLRLRRRVLNEFSNVGSIITSRVGTDGSYSYAGGLDATLRLFGDDYLVLNWAQTLDDSLVKAHAVSVTNTARARVQWERRTTLGFGYEASMSYAGPEFDPAVGFAPRVDYYRVGDRVFYGWLPGETSSLQGHVLSFTANAFFRKSDGQIESSEIGPEWTAGFKSGASAIITLKHLTESLTESFEISDQTEVPAGNYNFTNLRIFYQSPWGSLLRSSFNLDAGSFYDGTRLSIGATPTWSISRHVELSGDYQFNRVRFSDRNQAFDAHIMRLRVKATLNTELSAASFIQYSSDAHDVTVNFRFRYNPREGNDFYLVYNEGINTDRLRELPVLPSNSSQTVLLKYSHTFQF